MRTRTKYDQEGTTVKPFTAFLAESEQDYEYKICSVENIHDPKVIEGIRMALGRYGLISLESEGIITKTNDSDGGQFAAYPFMPIYLTKVVMANPISSRHAEQIISVYTGVAQRAIQVRDKDDEVIVDGSDVEQHMHPVEVDSKTAQAEVGDARVQTLVSDLMKDITAEREKNKVVKEQREPHSGMVTSHIEVRRVLGESVPRGFYLVEQDETRTTVTGPFSKMPANYGYGNPSAMVLRGRRTLSEGLVEYEVSYHEPDFSGEAPDAPDRLEYDPMTVEVVDQDTGKTHTVVVRASTEDSARRKAVAILSDRLGVDKTRLMPTQPEEE